MYIARNFCCDIFVTNVSKNERLDEILRLTKMKKDYFCCLSLLIIGLKRFGTRETVKM